MKATSAKVRRSGLCHLMTTINHVNETQRARSDVWGAAVVVILLLGVVGLMRMILAG